MHFFPRLTWAAYVSAAVTIPASALVSLSITAPVQAQSTLPDCPPPASQEYLLFVRGESAAERNEIATILPAESSVLICQYVDETVVRAGGFVSLETANAWATYMTTVHGYESFVIRPSAAPSVTTTPAPGQPGQYQPVRLGSGYAVLVDYSDDPTIAATVGQFVRPVGLAVYQQKSYLLAAFSNDPAVATSTLQRLSAAELSAVLVDAQQVVRLTTQVSR